MSAVLLPKELDEGRLDELLNLWERWMSPGAKSVMDLGYPNTATGCVGGGYSTSFEDMVDQADGRAAEAVNAAIEGLPMAQQAAVYNKHLFSVYRFHRGYQAEHYDAARQTLRVVLPQKGIY